jgi:hypothetical protein
MSSSFLGLGGEVGQLASNAGYSSYKERILSLREEE